MTNPAHRGRRDWANWDVLELAPAVFFFASAYIRTLYWMSSNLNITPAYRSVNLLDSQRFMSKSRVNAFGNNVILELVLGWRKNLWAPPFKLINLVYFSKCGYPGDGLDTAWQFPLISLSFKDVLLKITRFKILYGFNKYFG